MADSLRTDASRPESRPAAVERESRIEQLLLAGLDHYFAGQYEQAIHVWTRVLFLDRGHARARAYADRARSALGERQRESEELLHHGVAAFDRGESETARRLLQSAVERGAPADEALAVLDRLDRLEGSPSQAEPPASVGRSRRMAIPVRAARPRRSRSIVWLPFAIVTGLLALGLYALMSWGGLEAFLDWRPPGERSSLLTPSAEPLPIVRPGEIALDRARTLTAAGHLFDALGALDEVRLEDPLRPDADRLRGVIQQQLLAVVSAQSIRPVAAAPGPSARSAGGQKPPDE